MTDPNPTPPAVEMLRQAAERLWPGAIHDVTRQQMCVMAEGVYEELALGSLDTIRRCLLQCSADQLYEFDQVIMMEGLGHHGAAPVLTADPATTLLPALWRAVCGE